MQQLRLAVLVAGNPAFQARRLQPFGNLRQGGHFQQAAHLIGIADEMNVESRHHQAAFGNGHQQTLRLEARDGLTHGAQRCAGHVHEFTLADKLAGPQAA
ncbi:hypothetical protein V6L77_24195 [Pannonibacter sp. Pt2-lr]